MITLGVGGAGRTALQRILLQAGAQGGIEAVNQAAGVQEERRIQGLSHGLADAAMRVGVVAAGGGLLQGVGEAAAFAGKRWFSNARNDPAPSPGDVVPDQVKKSLDAPARERQGPPAPATARTAPEPPENYLSVRDAAPRFDTDVADITSQLMRWDGPTPATALPRTSNVTFPGTREPAKLDTAGALEYNARYQAAKRVDPAAFARMESLQKRQDTYRRWIDDLTDKAQRDVSDLQNAIDERIVRLEAKMRTQKGKGAKAKLREQIRDAKADREEVLKLSGHTETADVQRLRRELVELHGKAGEVAPLIGRAFARSRNDWSVPGRRR